MGFEVGDTQKLEAQYETLSTKLTTLRKKQADLNKTDLSKVTKNMDNIGDSVSKTIKKIGRWVLAVFAIESAYGAVRSAMSTLSQSNKKISADISYIKFALASAIQPIVEGLIQLAYKLMVYVGYIAKAWFGVDIWANASAKAFGKANSQAKDLKKTMAGFDEANVAGDKGGANGGANGVGVPSFDLDQKDVKIPSWVQWLSDNGETLAGIIMGISFAILAVNAGIGGFKALGIGIIIFGVYSLVQDVLELFKDPTWDKFNDILRDMSIIIIGIGIAFVNLPVAVAGAMGLLLYYVTKNWEKVENLFNKGMDKIHQLFQNLFGNGFISSMLEEGFVFPFKWGFERLKGYVLLLRGVFEGFSLFMKGDWSGGIKSILKGIANFFIGVINSLIIGINGVISPIRLLIVAAGKVMGKNWSFSNIKIPTLRYLKTGGIVNMPGRGVPIGGAIGGEAGQEGVIPLTDNQAMATLGEYIGKYVNIENVINNYMDSRKISRIMASSNNRSSLASNG